MIWRVSFVLLALVVACSDSSDGGGGTAGIAGAGGVGGGTAGTGGAGGAGGGGADLCESVDCDDRNDCTDDVCVPADGSCENPVSENGTACAEGFCIDGACGPILGTVFPCTEAGIRAAIATGGGPLTFDCDGPATILTKAEIAIDNDVVLDGEGDLTLDAQGTHRVLRVASDITAELRGFAVTNGSVGDVNYYDSGGGIMSFGMLTLTDSIVSGNKTVMGSGGGIYIGYGALTLTNSTVSGNSATEGGGGIESDGRALTVTNSTISGNAAGRLWGGGIYARSMTMTNSTVSGNTAGHTGGGLFLLGPNTIVASTISGNTADGRSSGIENQGTLTLANSLVEGGCEYVTPGWGTTTSDGYNIESPGDTCSFAPDGTDQNNVSTEQLSLGPLADNGGPTMTHALGPASVAIDVIPEIDCKVETDQRAQPRPGGTTCDVGASELQP